jgi:hypothetical protein
VCLNDRAPGLGEVFHGDCTATGEVFLGNRTATSEVLSLPYRPYLDEWVRTSGCRTLAQIGGGRGGEGGRRTGLGFGMGGDDMNKAVRSACEAAQWRGGEARRRGEETHMKEVVRLARDTTRANEKNCCQRKRMKSKMENYNF